MAAPKRRLTEVLERLDLPITLQERMHVTCNEFEKPASSSSSQSIVSNDSSFVLYLPTVVLRHQHNPALALACRLANHYQLPLVILCVVLDDAHHPLMHVNIKDDASSNDNAESNIVATARRLTFYLQALQKATRDWRDELGNAATVLVRVHGPSARTPHHLTLARQAAVTVQDEPFVHPYLHMVQAVERACASSKTPCVRVDGSTTVPPVCMLKQKRQPQQQDTSKNAATTFQGVPAKAWMWQKQTQPKRKAHVQGAVLSGHLDAPPLLRVTQVRVDSKDVINVDSDSNDNAVQQQVPHYFPKEWKDPTSSAPGKRPWTVEEFLELNIEEFVATWPGVDRSVPPCPQTRGGLGMERWQRFLSVGLASYAAKRNNIQLPHAVSRMSCYLNLGTVSIFQIVHDMWTRKTKSTEKFEDEIIKWREIGYAHAFAAPDDYFGPSAVPVWARSYLQQRGGSSSNRQQSQGQGYTLHQLAHAQTDDATWNAMQDYLVQTGELHNNARMTWGKTLTHWLASSVGNGNANANADMGLRELLHHLAYCNDRFALDGLSPPSYAGLLWCLGWGDKPAAGGGISTKPASRYRCGPEGFSVGQRLLLQGGAGGGVNEQPSVRQFVQPRKKQKRDAKPSPKKKSPSSKSIQSFFPPVDG
jgi:hypothetical protein